MQKNQKLFDLRKFIGADHWRLGFVALSIFVLIASAVPIVNANSRQQINQIQQEIDHLKHANDDHEHEQGILGVEAASLSDAINKFQAQIDASQARINQLEGDITALKQQIVETEAELVRQKALLGQTIRVMYLEGEITTVEMLATSKNLSDFFDKQQHRESVRSKVKTTLDTITKLKLELKQKEAIVQATLNEQQALRNQLVGQRAEKDRILAMNVGQQNQLENEIRANSGKLAQLKKRQAEAEAALARSLSSGSYRGVSSGRVAAGQAIGLVGNTGFSSGPHLHLEARSGGRVINPAPYIKAQPVDMPPAWISQGYGEANSWYSSGYHSGIDYAGRHGATIYSVDSGNLSKACIGGYGYVAIVDQDNGVQMIYGHMSGGPPACNYNTFNR